MVEIQNQQEQVSEKFEGLSDVNDVDVDSFIEDGDKPKTITLKEAQKIIEENKKLLRLNLDEFDGFNSITSINLEIAQEISSKFSGNTLSLNGLTFLDHTIAAKLVKTNVKKLQFNGLTSSPTIATLEELVKFKGTNLELNGIQRIKPEHVQILSTFQGKGLGLNGLISPLISDVAEELVKFKGTSISLKNLDYKYLSEDTKKKLDTFSGTIYLKDGEYKKFR